MCLLAGLSMRRRREVSPLRFFLAMISVGKSPFAKTLQANKSTEHSLLIRFVYWINLCALGPDLIVTVSSILVRLGIIGK